MHIAFVVSSMGAGGAERVIANIANQLVKRRYKVTIITLEESVSFYSLNDNVELRSYKYDSSNKVSTFFKAIKSLRRAFYEVNPDVLISFLTTVNIYSIMAKNSKKTPLIISERSNPYVAPKKKYYRLLRKITYNYSDGFVFQTKDAHEFFNSRIQERSIVIQNPVLVRSDTDVVNINTKKIITAGRLEPEKNHKLLIDAFKIVSKDLNNYTLTIYGEGSMRKELEGYIKYKNLEGKVFLEGKVKDISQRMKEASLFVLSSDYEGMSNALMEAMSIGLPCISTDCPIGGSRDLIENGKNGILVPIRDREKMANAMIEILTNIQLAKKLGSQAKKICNSNSLEVITNQWEKYILRVYNEFHN